VNISSFGQVAGYEIWISNDLRITNPHAIIEENLEVIQRFENILTLLRDKVYKIENSAVSIFYDFDGPLIAFNRDGCIFVNLRVYKQWYDKFWGGNEAISFYYFVFGHEIAHNLVDAHNTDHEIFFSKLCEKHLNRLSQFLTNSGAETTVTSSRV